MLVFGKAELDLDFHGNRGGTGWFYRLELDPTLRKHCAKEVDVSHAESLKPEYPRRQNNLPTELPPALLKAVVQALCGEGGFLGTMAIPACGPTSQEVKT